MSFDFETVYDENFRYVKMVCLRIVKDDTLAEDLAQETFIQVFKNLDNFRGGCKISTWIYSIAVNQCRMHLRKRKLEICQIDGEVRNLKAIVSKPNDVLLLEHSLSRLPKGYRAAFLLREHYGFTHAEVGELMGYTEGNAKSQNFKAKRSLRKLVNLQT